MLCNRGALFLCSSVALTLGQHLKLATGLFIVAASLFQWNFIQVQDQNFAVCFGLMSVPRKTNAHPDPPAMVAVMPKLKPCMYVLRLLCSSWGRCVCGPALYKLVFYSVSQITDGRLWSLPGLSLLLALLSKSLLLRQTHITELDPPRPSPALTQRRHIHLRVIHITVDSVCNQHLNTKPDRQTQHLMYVITVVTHVKTGWRSCLYSRSGPPVDVGQCWCSVMHSV